MKPFIVIPTYNEAGNIKELAQHVLSLHPEFSIIIVDDNSPDGTGSIADELAKEDSRVSVLHRPGKSGLGTAYIEGFKSALEKGADLVFEMDADFSHDPMYLRNFLEASKHAHLVIGSRYINGVRVEGWSFRRLILSKFANIYASRIMLRPIWDFTSGFRCYRREVLEALDLDNVRSDGYSFQIEMIHLSLKKGFSIAETPIIFRARKTGFSKITRKIKQEAFFQVLKYHAPFPLLIRFVWHFLENSEHFYERISKAWKK